MNELNTTNIINNYSNYNDNLNITMTYNDTITNQDSKNEIDSTTNLTTDSIDLNPNKKNITNKINAQKAFNETHDNMALSVKERIKVTLEYGRIASEMRDQGYDVPDFNLDNSESKTSTFLQFISKMKEFSKTYFSSGKHLISPEIFYNFCDKFEENLNKYNCF